MLKSPELFPKSYLAGTFGSTPKKDLLHYFRHPDRRLLVSQLVRRQKLIKGLKRTGLDYLLLFHAMFPG
jgi:hypothetical protein